jgi:Lanthionine synthetase C-like protein
MDAVWEKRLFVSGKPFFPYNHGDPNPARLAWCYGGLGIAIMFKNGLALSEKYLDHLIQVIDASRMQYVANAHGMFDASVCHGFAGAGLIFDHLSRVEHLPTDMADDMSRLSLEAFGRAFEALREDALKEKSEEQKRKDENMGGFLGGKPGVMLAARAIGANKPPAWTALLACY